MGQRRLYDSVLTLTCLDGGCCTGGRGYKRNDQARRGLYKRYRRGQSYVHFRSWPNLDFIFA